MEKKAKLTLKLAASDICEVKKGDHISFGDTLIRFKEAKVQEFNLAEMLKIPPKNFKKYLKISDGAKVDENTVIAVKSGVLQKQILRSPQKGTFKIIDNEKGIVGISQNEKKEAIVSWFNGTVLEVTGENIVIELSGVTISAKTGRGKPVSGMLLYISEVIEMLTMPTDLENKILVTRIITPDIAAKADALGVAALIAEELQAPPFELPYLVLTEISELKSYNGKTIIVYGDENQLLIVDDSKKNKK